MPEKRKKILLVDDEQMVRKLTKTTLASENYEIFEAENGRQALEIAEEILPDLILLDINMPDISGFEISCRIRKNPKLADTYIIMLTGVLEESVRNQGFEAGANDFFTKPFRPVQLLDKIRALLDCKENLCTVHHMDSALETPKLPDFYRFRSIEELKKLENEQLMLYAMDLSRVYQNEQIRSKELNSAFEKLKDMEKMKDIFIALVSHELKTPLSIIKGYFYLLSEVLSRSTIEEDVSGFLNPISKSILRLEELMGELLDFSRMKSGLLTFEKKEISIIDEFNILKNEFISLFAAKNIDFKVVFEGDFRPIKADRDKLREAFEHLINNALKFTDSGGEFTITCKDEGVCMVIQLKDSGPGIPEDQQDKIFNPFYQVSDFLTREVGGMGLGLSIAKHIIEDHGGNIKLESALGEGSTFIVRLPRSYQDAREMVAELKQAYPKQLDELSKSLKSTQEQLSNYTQELSKVFAREKAKTEQLEKTLNALQRTYIQTIAALARSVDLKDAYSGGHTDRVSFYACAIAKKIDPQLLQDRNFRYSLLLHDIGKIGIAEEILSKMEKLTDEEWQILKQHPQQGVEILREAEFLFPALSSVRSHHERWDGRGYPDGLAGEEIPLAARIIAISDAFDAMTSTRPYRSGMSMEEARQEIINQSGQQFDPNVVKHFLEAWDEIVDFAKQVNKIVDLERRIIDLD